MEEEVEILATPGVRYLGGDAGDYFLVDQYGNEYDQNSLAWRYLGLYVDCNGQDEDGDGHSQDQDGADGTTTTYCQRKLLWAAYIDPRYRGNGIREYQIYDPIKNKWDDTTCSGGWGRCAKLDCHEEHTGFDLLGVYKETDGMYDWWEQLFKHLGVCVWNDEEDYATMHTWMEAWPNSCQLLDMTDSWGKPLYLDLMPVSGGDMKLAVYTDSSCSKVSSMDYETYTIKYYKSLGYRNQTMYNVAREYAEAIDTWNKRMNSFKVCQPCIAYNTLGGGNGNRFYQEKDYSCYDKAGYTNVNQCYKFGSKTKLEVASVRDLKSASRQGTILRIAAYRRAYGKGVYGSSGLATSMLIAFVAIIGLAVIGLSFRRREVIRKRNDRQGKRWGGKLKESLASDGGIKRSDGSNIGRVIEEIERSRSRSQSRSQSITRNSSTIKKALNVMTRTASRTTPKKVATTNEIDFKGPEPPTTPTPQEQETTNRDLPRTTLV
jgi:hypothetical protein